jgi:hypothetical protein
MSKNLVTLIFGLILLWTTAPVFAEPPKNDCNPEEVFQFCDKNGDGVISPDEWDAIDTDKNKMITSDEWDKYRYKSGENKTKEFQIKFFSVYGNGPMSKEDFMQNFKRLQ